MDVNAYLAYRARQREIIPGKVNTPYGLATQIPLQTFINTFLPPLHAAIDLDKIIEREKRGTIYVACRTYANGIQPTSQAPPPESYSEGRRRKKGMVTVSREVYTTVPIDSGYPSLTPFFSVNILCSLDGGER